jgi:hypothetical protein
MASFPLRGAMATLTALCLALLAPSSAGETQLAWCSSESTILWDGPTFPCRAAFTEGFVVDQGREQDAASRIAAAARATEWIKRIVDSAAVMRSQVEVDRKVDAWVVVFRDIDAQCGVDSTFWPGACRFPSQWERPYTVPLSVGETLQGSCCVRRPDRGHGWSYSHVR